MDSFGEFPPAKRGRGRPRLDNPPVSFNHMPRGTPNVPKIPFYGSHFAESSASSDVGEEFLDDISDKLKSYTRFRRNNELIAHVFSRVILPTRASFTREDILHEHKYDIQRIQILRDRIKRAKAHLTRINNEIQACEETQAKKLKEIETSRQAFEKAYEEQCKECPFRIGTFSAMVEDQYQKLKMENGIFS